MGIKNGASDQLTALTESRHAPDSFPTRAAEDAAIRCKLLFALTKQLNAFVQARQINLPKNW